MEQILKGGNRDYLMGAALLYIIAFHFCYYSNLLENSIFSFFFSHGYVGVDVFFFLSAYGLCFSYEKNGVKRYYLNRVKRLYPVYLLFIATAVFFFHNGYADSAIELALFQCTGLASFRSVDFEWFIPALIVLYLVFPVVYIWLKWLYKKSKQLLPLVVLISILLVQEVSHFVFPLFALRFPIILIGIITYLALMSDDKTFLITVLLANSLFALVCKVDSALVLSMLIPSILWFLGAADVRLPFKKVIGFVGHHSLEIYLAQSLALNHYFLTSNVKFANKCLIALAILVVSSFVLFYFQKGFYSIFTKHEY